MHALLYGGCVLAIYVCDKQHHLQEPMVVHEAKTRGPDGTCPHFLPASISMHIQLSEIRVLYLSMLAALSQVKIISGNVQPNILNSQEQAESTNPG